MDIQTLIQLGLVALPALPALKEPMPMQMGRYRHLATEMKGNVRPFPERKTGAFIYGRACAQARIWKAPPLKSDDCPG